jgi:hypothetical protein
MTDVLFPEGDESVVRKYKDNGDGSYTEYVNLGSGSITVSGGSGGDASAANQTVVQSVAGSDASKANAVQGITGGKPVFINEIIPTPDADLTQKITCGAPGVVQQGPNKSNDNGWLLTPAATNTGVAYFMFHGQTAANKGFPMAVGGLFYVPVVDLNSLDFDVTTSGNIVFASKV